MRHQEILFNVTGQSFVFDPPETFQASGTPTVQVFLASNDDTGTTESATTGSCSVDSVNTTLIADAVAGDSSLSIASSTGVARGSRYLVTDVDGDCEWVDVIAVTGTTVNLRRPLINDYEISTSTFKGCRISIGVDPTWVATASKITDVLGADWHTDRMSDAAMYAGHAGYRLRWSYTVNGVATMGVSFADLVRYSAKNLVTPNDVDTRFPGWIDRLGPDYREDQGVSLIEEALHAVRMDALGDAQVLRRIRSTEVLHELVVFRANLMAVENQVIAGSNNVAGLDVAQKLYERRYNQLIREPKVAIDQSGGGANAAGRRLPVWRR